MFDLLIRNATIYDGSGTPAYLADVAIADGKIAAIGKELGIAKKNRGCGRVGTGTRIY